MQVRRAHIVDYPEMVKLICEYFQSQNAFTRFGLHADVDDTATLVEDLTLRHLVLLLVTDDSKIVGGVGGFIVPSLFNAKTKIFQDLVFYIRPEFRQYTQYLLTELKAECFKREVDLIIMAHMEDGNLDKMERYYQSKGFKRLETHFIARINT